MKCAVEMGSGATICTPSFMKTCSGIQKLMAGGYTLRYIGRILEAKTDIGKYSFVNRTIQL
jgi:hypothetical protein